METDLISHDEIHPGDIIIAHDDFALVLDVDDEGWPCEWMWLASGSHALMTNVATGTMKYLLEGRAILQPNHSVKLCQRDRSPDGWNAQALNWFRAAKKRNIL
jgi:hypothetical protein